MTKRKTKRTKKTSLRTQLKNWSKAVRDRDGNKCFLCGSTEHLQAHHILPKHGWKEHRLDENNGIALCAKCHSFGKWSVHNGASLFFYLKLAEERPFQFNYLRKIITEEKEKADETIR